MVADTDRFWSSTIIARECERAGKSVVGQAEMSKAEIKPDRMLTQDRASQIFEGNFLCQYDVTDALNEVFSRVFDGYNLEIKTPKEELLPFTEYQAALLAGGDWLCMYLPALPLTTVVELFKAAYFDAKGDVVQAITNFIGAAGFSDVHDLITRVFSIGVATEHTRQSGYVMLSREPLANVTMPNDAVDSLCFEKLMFNQFLTPLLIQLLMDRVLVKDCSYEFLSLRPGNQLDFAQPDHTKPGAPDIPFLTRHISFAWPKKKEEAGPAE
ncbi:hypothetical protein HQ571_06170 [Candidatus Kuenenbacteria bacterium]|nr:hypothetical protein [Candidatus Kuenenbacteria bacterium]